MILRNKRKRTKKVPPCVPIKKWLISVQKYGYVLEQLGAKTALNSRVKSRSVRKAKLAVLDKQADPNKAEIDEILADIPNSERNRNPTASQYSITCP